MKTLRTPQAASSQTLLLKVQKIDYIMKPITIYSVNLINYKLHKLWWKTEDFFRWDYDETKLTLNADSDYIKM